VLNFSIFASRRSKFTLWVELGYFRSYCCSPVLRAQGGVHATILFWRNNIEDGNCPSPGLGLFAALELEHPGLSLISYVKEKYLAFEPRRGSKSQHYSQRKPITLRSKNRKIRHEKQNFKSKRTRSLCVETLDLSHGIKNICPISWDYPFKGLFAHALAWSFRS
jgi:hypothetical protein